MRVLAILLVAMTACGGGGGSPHPDAARDGAHPDAPIDARSMLFPVAPTASTFMWPGQQQQLRRSDGSTCTAQLALAVADQAVCYATAGELRCAGAVYTNTYGSTFTAIGQTDVDEVTISLTSNTATGNSMCIHKTDHTLSCMGANTLFGALGTGDTNPTASFVQWAPTDLVHMIDLVDTMCALDSAGFAWCAGDNHTPTPTKLADAGNHRSAFIDESGTLQLDNASVFRASDGYTCQVEADGMHCLAPMAQMLSGTAGDVVDGTVISAPGGPAIGDFPACTLSSEGVVQCAVSGISAQLFAAAPPILELAGTFYSDSLCAIANDGSLWCKGTNAHGELGTGDTMPVTAEMQVQPPGTIDLSCQ